MSFGFHGVEQHWGSSNNCYPLSTTSPYVRAWPRIRNSDPLNHLIRFKFSVIVPWFSYWSVSYQKGRITVLCLCIRLTNNIFTIFGIFTIFKSLISKLSSLKQFAYWIHFMWLHVVLFVEILNHITIFIWLPQQSFQKYWFPMQNWFKVLVCRQSNFCIKNYNNTKQ